MRLILGPHDNYWLCSLASRLAAKGEPVLHLSAQDLIDELRVDDTIDEHQCLVSWEVHNQHFTNADVLGVLNFLGDLQSAYFSDFIEQDRAYAQAEWHAYLLFAIAQFQNCHNSAWGGSLSGFAQSLPYQWDYVHRNGAIGLSIPRFAYGRASDTSEPMRRGLGFVVSSSLFSYKYWNTDAQLELSPEHPYLFYERPRGTAILGSYIGSRFTWTEIRNGAHLLDFHLTEGAARALSELFRVLHISVGEVLLFHDGSTSCLTFGSLTPGLSPVNNRDHSASDQMLRRLETLVCTDAR